MLVHNLSLHNAGLMFRPQEHLYVLDIMFTGLDPLYRSLGLIGITIHQTLELLDELAPYQGSVDQGQHAYSSMIKEGQKQLSMLWLKWMPEYLKGN